MIIKGEIGKIEIDILTNKTSGTFDFWEENWLYANIKGNFPGFKVNYDCNLRTDDFQHCAEKLESMLSMDIEVAEFTTIEEGLQIMFIRGEFGDIKVKGKMIATELTQCVFEFKFTMDVPTLQRLIGEMQQVVYMYPLIGNPDS